MNLRTNILVTGNFKGCRTILVFGLRCVDCFPGGYEVIMICVKHATRLLIKKLFTWQWFVHKPDTRILYRTAELYGKIHYFRFSIFEIYYTDLCKREKAD